MSTNRTSELAKSYFVLEGGKLPESVLVKMDARNLLAIVIWAKRMEEALIQAEPDLRALQTHVSPPKTAWKIADELLAACEYDPLSHQI